MGEGTLMLTASMVVWAPPNRPGRPDEKVLTYKNVHRIKEKITTIDTLFL
jgi:hypothetical protein